MVNRSWPLDAVSGAPVYSGRALRQSLMAPVLGGATAGRPLGGRSGVRPGTSVATVSATSTAWSCGAHAGVLDVQSAGESGPYGYAVDATVSGSVTAANASNPRVDIVYVQLSDPAEGDGTTTPGVTVGYLAGTAAATPVAPTKPARSLVLAQINVPKSGGGNPTVTWVASYSAASGGVVDYPSKAVLLADAPPVGTLGKDIQTGSVYEFHPGSPAFWSHIGGAPDVGAWTPLGIYVTNDATRPVRAYSQSGRIFAEGNIASNISANFVAGEEYAMGKFPDAYGIKATRTYWVDNNSTRMLVRVYPDGTIGFRPTSSFSGVLSLSLDGLSWIDKRF